MLHDGTHVLSKENAKLKPSRRSKKGKRSVPLKPARPSSMAVAGGRFETYKGSSSMLEEHQAETCQNRHSTNGHASL